MVATRARIDEQAAPHGEATVTSLFWSRVDEHPAASALRSYDGRAWRSTTWQEYGDAVAELSAGLVELGVRPGDRVGLVASNQARWHEADLAVMCADAATVPAYATSASGQIAYILHHSGARLCFVGGRDQLAKVLLARHRLPALEHVVMLGDVPEGLDDGFVLQFDDVRERGRATLALEPASVRERVHRQSPETIATIVYTSGTTGPPKGAVLTHRNLIATIESITSVVDVGASDRFLSFLPLSHIAERVVSHFGQIVAGGETWFARSLSTVADDLVSCRPTVFFAVPRVWEKFQEAILDQVAQLPAPIRRASERYFAAGARRAAARRSASRRTIRERVDYRLLDATMGHQLRAKLGLDRSRILVSAAAPIDPELLWWFDGIGLPICEVYGQTEDCGPTTLNPPGHIRIGTVGTPLPGVDVRIATDGEILVRGDNVCAGYYSEPDRTAELIDADHWMHSGDLGWLDPAGYLHVTGRKKDLIITSSGENIAPQDLETRLRSDPLVSQAVVTGDGRKYLTALLALDAESLAHWAEANGKVADFEALLDDPDLHTELDELVQRVNVGRARIEQLKAWRVIPHELTVAAGELTPTLKVRRDVVANRYGNLIDEMYAA